MKVKNSKRLLCLLMALTIISCGFTVTNASGEELAQILEATEEESLSEEQVVSEEEITSVEQETTESNDTSGYADYTNSISGVVWLDNSAAMGDGIYDSVEQTIADYTVSLYRSADTSTAIQTTTTEASGAYEFSGLEPDTYIVGITSETISGTEYLLPLVGITSDNKFAMDESMWSNAFTDPITLNTDTVVTDINAGVRSSPTPQTMSGNYDVSVDVSGINTPLGTYATLADACNDINSDGGTTYIITATQSDTSMGTVATIKAGKDVTLTSDTGGPYTITQQTTDTTDNAGGRHILVAGTLRLENITLAGDGHTSGSSYNGGVYVNRGSLIMNSGSTIQNCYAYNGGGVYVASSGTLTMDDGTIGSNAANNSGGGVYVNSSSFTMDDGTISNNAAKASGGGVSVISSGTFTMNDGTISSNAAETTGGGAYVYSSTFTMNDGTISNNIANTSGGGVCTIKSSITMNKGTISHNEVKLYGGGMYCNESSFTMYDGAIISDNTSQTNGGGVYVGTNSKVEMNGGKISDNAAEGMSGGVLVGIGCEFHMYDGAISGNTAKTMAGGVYILSNNTDISSFIMDGGEISSNTATNGGGVYLTGSKTIFTMNDGRISDNTATNGGGVYLTTSGSITATSGSITNNSASVDGGGIYTDNYSYKDPAATTKYTNVNTSSSVEFSGNTASASYEPPSNYAFFTNLLSNSTSTKAHILNNDDVNYKRTDISVTYHPNGGVGSDYNDANHSSGSTYTFLDNATNINLGYTKVGYTFTGWNTAADGSGDAYSAGNTFQILGDIALYAQWEEILGSITIHKQDALENDLENVYFTIEQWDNSTSDYVLVSSPAGDKTDSDGLLKFDYLSAGKYQITEVKPVDGYSLLIEPIEVTIPYVKVSDTDPNDGYEYSDGNNYYYYDLTYTITNSVAIELPQAGNSNVLPIVFVLIGVGIVTVSVGLFIYNNKRNLKNRA